MVRQDPREPSGGTGRGIELPFARELLLPIVRHVAPVAHWGDSTWPTLSHRLD
jgi:hypothetical protein